VLSQVAPWLGRHELWLFGNWSLTITLVTFALSLPIAYASYRLFELPFLKRKEAPVRPAAAQPVVPDPARAGAPAGGG
jgi:peptidoglycan/LPS O-acetylase OafA/YrhL